MTTLLIYLLILSTIYFSIRQKNSTGSYPIGEQLVFIGLSVIVSIVPLMILILFT